MRRTASALLFGTLLLLGACGGGDEADVMADAEAGHQQALALSTSTQLSTAGAATGAKVCFYADINFGGRSSCVGAGASSSFASMLDNRVSSVRVPAGLSVDLFDRRTYAGSTISLSADVANLTTLAFNDLASSYRVAALPAPAVRRWSDPATWGGRKPVAGAAVVIPAGLSLVLDESTPDLGPVTIEGQLAFAEGMATELKAAVVMVRKGGVLRAGSEAAPFAGRATITLTASDPAADPSGKGMGTRGILVYGGGRLQLFGRRPNLPWTRLAANAEAGASQLRLADAVDWRAGDQIVVAPTEWYPVGPWESQALHDAAVPTERRTLRAAAAGDTLDLQSGLTHFRWGALQYMTDDGLRLERGAFAKPHPEAADVLDERAEVGNLTRDIVIQGLDDDLWRNSGLGAQVMVMDLASSLQLDGVELRRVGQAGRLGRYPIHWHLLSINPANGAELGDASGHFVRNSSIWDSRQRCIVIHGTNGVELRGNICHDIKGHAIFLEDAAERRNVIEGNLVLRVRSPADALLVALHERRGDAGGCGGAAAGYWLTNPDNTVRHNAVADAQGAGFWLSYPERPVKDSARQPIRPVNLRHAPFEFNSARANGHYGMVLECAMTNNAGNTAESRYAPTTTGQAFDYQNGERFTLRGLTMAKNRRGGYLNRTTTPDYRQFVLAGNLQRSITGAVEGGTMKHALVVARSLNDRQSEPADLDPPLGIASYHSQMDIAQNTFAGFRNHGFVLTANGWDKSSGTFGTDDYYVRPVDKGYVRNPDNRLIGSDPGYRALPPHLQPGFTPSTRNHWTLAGALWDPYGHWGERGRYWVLDDPFLREPSCASVASRVPAGLANGLSCAGPYHGVLEFQLNRGLSGATQPYLFTEKLAVTRLDDADAVIGSWVIEDGASSNFLGHMRHFAAVSGGRYIVRFPGFPQGVTSKTPPRWVQLQVENLREDGEHVLLGIHVDGTTAPGRVFVSTEPDYAVFSGEQTNARWLEAAASREAVVAGAGNLYWQDKSRHLVWVKLVPLGLAAPWISVRPGSDADLYRSYRLRIEP